MKISKLLFAGVILNIFLAAPVLAWDSKIERDYQIDHQRYEADRQRQEQEAAQHRMDQQMHDMQQRQDDLQRQQRDSDFRSRSPRIGQNY